MARFQEGKEFELLNTIGIKYGYIIVKSHGPLLVTDLEIGEIIINSGVAKNILTNTDAQKIKVQMGKIGLCENMLDVFEKIQKFTIPDDTPTQLYSFKKCESKTCPLSSVHGNIFSEHNGAVVNMLPLTELSMGYSFCFMNMKENNMSPLNAVIMLKEMLESGLANQQPKDIPRPMSTQKKDDKLKN